MYLQHVSTKFSCSVSMERIAGKGWVSTAWGRFCQAVRARLEALAFLSTTRRAILLAANGEMASRATSHCGLDCFGPNLWRRTQER